MNKFDKIQRLLQEKADCKAKLNLITYDGFPEVNEKSGIKYIYMRKRLAGKLKSTYVGTYSKELHQLLLNGAKESKKLKKQINKIDKELALNGYASSELSIELMNNLDFAKANMSLTIYDQAILEGISTTFPQTDNIINNGVINGMSSKDVQKILNLKHAWEFILDKDVIQSDTDYYLLCHIASLINEGLFYNGGRPRCVPVYIGGSSYVPPIPLEPKIKEDIKNIINYKIEPIDKAIKLCLYCMRTQIFIDGNKRSAIIFANHFMISNTLGLIIIPEKHVPEFKDLLIKYYETNNEEEISKFLKTRCWKKLTLPI